MHMLRLVAIDVLLCEFFDYSCIMLRFFLIYQLNIKTTSLNFVSVRKYRTVPCPTLFWLTAPSLILAEGSQPYSGLRGTSIKCQDICSHKNAILFFLIFKFNSVFCFFVLSVFGVDSILHKMRWPFILLSSEAQLKTLGTY